MQTALGPLWGSGAVLQLNRATAYSDDTGLLHRLAALSGWHLERLASSEWAPMRFPREDFLRVHDPLCWISYFPP